jgi:hypothetical protein
MTLLRPALLLLALPLLAACNEARAPQAAVPAQRPGTYAATDFPVVVMPQGDGCAAVIGRYDAVLKADWESGNVAERVYNQIQKELEPVRSACTGGRDGEARAMVAANKARHGYPTNN